MFFINSTIYQLFPGVVLLHLFSIIKCGISLLLYIKTLIKGYIFLHKIYQVTLNFQVKHVAMIYCYYKWKRHRKPVWDVSNFSFSKECLVWRRLQTATIYHAIPFVHQKFTEDKAVRLEPINSSLSSVYLPERVCVKIIERHSTWVMREMFRCLPV